MAKFEKKINELGLEIGKLSKSLNSEVNEYYKGINEVNELRESLESAEVDEVEGIENDINEAEEALNDFDELLVEKIEKYNLNKASYDEKLRKMAEGRERAKLAKAQGGTPPTPNPQPKATPPIDGGQPQPTPTPNSEPKEEEKSDWSWLIVAGIVGALTLGAVVLRKK